MWRKRGWAEHPAGEHTVSDSETSGHSNRLDQDYKPHKMQQHPHEQDSEQPTAKTSGSRWSMFQMLISILRLIPGAQSISFLNAAVLGLLGALATLAAAAGGLTMLSVLLARWYLPALETHIALPMHFDYAAGPSAAGAWIPLLRPSPITATLTPPPQRVSAAAAGLTPIQIQGSLGPGSSLSFSSSSSSTGDQAAGLLNPGSGGGFLGLGFGPASRAAAAAASAAKQKGGWIRGRRSSSRSAQSAAATAAAAAAAAGVDVGSGIVVPERDWLVPQWGRMGLKVVLEMPGWPETDLVQVTGEIVSQQGIVLGRSTRTWVPKPKPLLFRLMSFVIFGPWRALGLVDDTVRVKLPMFDSFQNPAAPPGGWGSVQHLLQPNSNRSGSKEGAEGAAAAAAGSSDKVVGPRAMWLRVTMIGRSAERGPPRVYRAAAVLDRKLGLLDRIAASMRPSIPTVLLLLLGSSGLALGSGSTAAALLLAAYGLYSFGSNIAAAARDAKTDPAAAAAAGAEEEQCADGDGEPAAYTKPAKSQAYEEYDRQYYKADSTSDAKMANAGFAQDTSGNSGRESSDSSTGPAVDKTGNVGSRKLPHDDSFLGHATGVLAMKQQGSTQDIAPAAPHTTENYAVAAGDQLDMKPAKIGHNMPAPLGQQQQQQQRSVGTGKSSAFSAATAAAAEPSEIDTNSSSAAFSANSTEYQPEGSHYLILSKVRQQQQQRQDSGSSSGSGAVSAIAKMVGSGSDPQQQQQQQQQRVNRESGGAEAENELMHDAGVTGLSADGDDDEWQEQLLAESDDSSSSTSTPAPRTAATARRDTQQAVAAARNVVAAAAVPGIATSAEAAEAIKASLAAARQAAARQPAGEEWEESGSAAAAAAAPVKRLGYQYVS